MVEKYCNYSFHSHFHFLSITLRRCRMGVESILLMFEDMLLVLDMDLQNTLHLVARMDCLVYFTKLVRSSEEKKSAIQ